ncbi:glycosyltransferase family 39 protein [Spirilliplanes yamanashiensis]|uniref:Dolichyl-phosphate-mannose-protein mannosyltransferase n=1 Tax=Spirilliplanes yamanashiensis TaxID=42233 RepID=A0A8J4DKE1_9ACTN|nr:glycosyltransferase family 39 protein [Spirilliplanes yamanashiensis]MDP9815706.1 hypothetical protein [Spirilliplanes yamanashiensis]GIJ03960.1 hypothetical protein Sya03_33120 [Spirilliplanes yamanashiensis]
MTAPTLTRPTPLRPAATTRRDRLRAGLTRHRADLLVAAALLLVVGLAQGINFDGYPWRLNDDEGTYGAQAYAFLEHGRLSHYTYWYDHPPFGWMTIAAYAWLTDGFDRAPTAVTVVREAMLVATVVACGFLYLLLRRLDLPRYAAAAAVLLFGLSPVAIFFHRLGFLDNLEMAWTLAAFAVIASPRRSLGSVFAGALLFAAAVLTKETAGILLPALLWLLAQRHRPGHRGWAFAVFLPTFVAVGCLYPLYAILKNELFEGPGHVSLIGALKWQLVDRESSGSLLDPGSVTHALTRSWLDVDGWLLLGALALLPAAMAVRTLRPFGLAYGLQILLMCRGGYLPQAYVISLLPFAAIIIAGTGAALWSWRPAPRRTAGRAAVLTALLVFAVAGAPAWASALHTATTQNPSVYSRQATQWIKDNVPRDATIVVDDNIWTDLERAGYTRQTWLYKVDLDPEVNATLLPNGYRDIEYVILLQLPPDMLKGMPTLVQAIDNSHVVTTFGEGNAKIVVRKVDR